MTTRLLRDTGWALIIVPAINFFIFILGALDEPSIIIRHWDVYVPFIILPWVAGIALLMRARKQARRESGS